MKRIHAIPYLIQIGFKWCVVQNKSGRCSSVIPFRKTFRQSAFPFQKDLKCFFYFCTRSCNFLFF